MRAPLRLLDLFSGIGGFSLGLERTGAFVTTSFCEIDPFCRQVLAKHWPSVPCHDDVTTREFHEGEADAICGGFPCQDVSLAGKRAGLSGARSGLYRELVRAVRVVRPIVALVENVAALLSDGMGTVLGDLAESRDCRWVEWDCVPASAIGAPHQRDRVWIVAHADDARLGFEPVDAEVARTPEHGGGRTSPDPSREQVGAPGQPRRHIGMEPSSADAASIGRGEGWQGRPPDSFAGIRDEARRNAADPYGARLAFNERVSRKDADGGDGRKGQRTVSPYASSIWPDEPALSGVDDGDAYWMERIRATGNQVVPQIPEIIGRAIASTMRATP